jgi:hypothetical protein
MSVSEFAVGTTGESWGTDSLKKTPVLELPSTVQLLLKTTASRSVTAGAPGNSSKRVPAAVPGTAMELKPGTAPSSDAAVSDAVPALTQIPEVPTRLSVPSGSV